MSHTATNWALRQKGLKPATKIVLINLADRHNPDHGCFPSKKKLAEDCEMSERSVADHINILVDAGLVQVQKASNSPSGQFASNRYILGFESDFCRGQDLPSAEFAVGKNSTPPSAEFAVDRRQNLPTNPVIEPRKGTSKAEGPQFSEFWSRWPAKVAKKDAEKAWKKLKPDERAEAFAKCVEWYRAWRSRHPDASTIYPATFLNGRRWQDEDNQPSASKQYPAGQKPHWLVMKEREDGRAANDAERIERYRRMGRP